MANPSSTSSKRLVGLGLRGMRNSIQAPPTQMTAQIKSALAQSSPRTSPTVNFAPSGTMATVTTATPGGLTRTTTTSPSGTSMRTSPSMVTMASITHPNAAQHPGIMGGNTTMTRSPTSPIGIKTFGGGSANTSPTLLSRTVTTTTMTSPFGTPTSTPFVTPNTSPQMVVSAADQVASVVASSVNAAGGGGNFLVESGSAIPVDTNQKIPFMNTGARNVKSPYGEYRNAVDGYFGPMKRLEEIVNEISEEMREVGREGEGSSPHNEDAKDQRVPLSPELQRSPMFFDVPFPLHPEKTFRIHSSPTTGNELIVNGNPNVKSRPESTIPRPNFLTHSPTGRVVSNATTITGSTPSPTGKSGRILSNNNTVTPPKTLNTPVDTRSDNFLQRFISSTMGPSSLAKSTKPRKTRFSPSPSPSSASYYSPIHPTSSPRSSPSSNYSRMSGGDSSDYRSLSTSSPLATKSKSNFEGQLVSSPPPSPSSSLSRWLRDGYEEGYSTICSPSSSPLLSGDGDGVRRLRPRTASIASSTSQDGSGVGLASYSSVESLSPRKRTWLNSPVAKIETVLGPRERGIGCIPEKRDYYSLYSSLRSRSMSPGSLTPLEENESMDFSFGVEDRIQKAADTDSSHFNNPAPSPPSPSPCLPDSLPISGMPVITSSDNVVVANAAVGILSGVGTGTAAVAAATATASAPRLGLRRKSTGVGSPLVNVVATYDSIKNEQARGGKQIEENKEGEEEDLDYGDPPMSPILMRTKDSLLLKDMQKQKRKNTMNAGMMATSIMEKSDMGVPTSNSAPLVDSGIGWNTVSEELRFLVDTEMKTRGFRLRDVGEMQCSSPPFCSPESICTADYLAEPSRSLGSPTQVPIPDTPTIGPCTMTASGSKPVDEAISPLQLSSPILPSVACS